MTVFEIFKIYKYLLDKKYLSTANFLKHLIILNDLKKLEQFCVICNYYYRVMNLRYHVGRKASAFSHEILSSSEFYTNTNDFKIGLSKTQRHKIFFKNDKIHGVYCDHNKINIFVNDVQLKHVMLRYL